jgi:hypothetical protein
LAVRNCSRSCRSDWSATTPNLNLNL